MYLVDAGTVTCIPPAIVILLVGMVDIPAHSFMVTEKITHLEYPDRYPQVLFQNHRPHFRGRIIDTLYQ
jgi:hypothetical protein